MLLLMAVIDKEEDKQKFEELYYKYRDKMWYSANRILNDSQAAEDAVQEALFGIARNISSIKDVDSKMTFAYVTTAAKNAALNIAEKNKAVIIDITQISSISHDNSESLFNALETNDYVDRILKTIPEKYRQVMYLRFVQELKINDIASLLGESNAAVRQQIKRGRNMFIDAYRKGEKS